MNDSKSSSSPRVAILDGLDISLVDHWENFVTDSFTKPRVHPDFL